MQSFPKILFLFSVSFFSLSISFQRTQQNEKSALKEDKFTKSWLFGGPLTVTLNSTTHFNFTPENQIQLSAHIPAFKNAPCASVKPDLLIEHIFCKSCKAELKQEAGKVMIWSDWSEKIPQDFIHFLYGACRVEWIKRGIFPVHAACIGNDTQGYVLLMGLPGSGKTSMTLYNVLNKNLKVFSGDKTLVTCNNGYMQAIAGTKTMTVRLPDVTKWVALKKIDENIFGDRFTFQLSSNYYSNLSSVPIKQIFFISLRDEPLINSKLTPLSALHTLYPFFMDKQREDVLIGGAQTFFDGSIPRNIRKEFINNLNDSLQNIEVYTISGSLEAMSTFIQEKSGYVVKKEVS